MALADLTEARVSPEIAVALLTGGGDRPYAYGLATALISQDVRLDLIAGDELDSPELHARSGVNFLNLRGNQQPDACLARKVARVLVYYGRLIRYASTARPKIFHILWNNKFEVIDRTLLMLYYKIMGKKIILTAHNVNAGRRDSSDTLLNRLTLSIQYRLSDHICVHTEKMKSELLEEFGIGESVVTVIPFGINNAVPNTSLTPAEAKQRLGIMGDEKTILFFGNIAPYKGLEYLIAAFQRIVTRRGDYRLIIAGRPKNCEQYWNAIQETIRRGVGRDRIMLKSEYIADDETEVYFKAADVLILPYKQIYQSGVLFLGYSFGLPVVAADLGALREDIIEGKTGLLFRPEDPVDLARAIETYFASDLFKGLNSRRQEIRDYAHERHSWDVVSQITRNVYAELLGLTTPVLSP
jgi:glycosyltransferase involved in cell wall biosynthesis